MISEDYSMPLITIIDLCLCRVGKVNGNHRHHHQDSQFIIHSSIYVKPIFFTQSHPSEAVRMFNVNKI